MLFWGFFFLLLLLGFGRGRIGSCQFNSRFAPGLVVTGARLYFYDHSFVTEDTSEVLGPPEYADEVLMVAQPPLYLSSCSLCFWW